MTLSDAIKVVEPPFVVVLVFKTEHGLGVVTDGDRGDGMETGDNNMSNDCSDLLFSA